MRRPPLLPLTLAACCLIAGCGGDPGATANENLRNATVPAAPPPPGTANTPAVTGSSLEDSQADGATGPGTEDVRPAPARDGTDAAAAVATIDAYYDAIDARDYGRAYRLWGDGGRASNQTPGDFAKGFAHTRSTSVATGNPGEPEGAAGSIYITIPVTVSAVTDGGEQQRFAGNYVLRRVNDVPGSTAEQRRWHIHSATLTRQ